MYYGQFLPMFEKINNEKSLESTSKNFSKHDLPLALCFWHDRVIRAPETSTDPVIFFLTNVLETKRSCETLIVIVLKKD